MISIHHMQLTAAKEPNSRGGTLMIDQICGTSFKPTDLRFNKIERHIPGKHGNFAGSLISRSNPLSIYTEVLIMSAVQCFGKKKVRLLFVGGEAG